MRIDNFAKATKDGKTKVSATVTWEDCDRPTREVWFVTDAEFADDIEPEPNAFLLGAILFAMRNGEKRVLVDGSVCPQLRTGLATAMKQLRAWYGEDRHQLVAIEASEGFHPPVPSAAPRVAWFFSGGVDSMATLRGNRLDYPLDHPGAIKDGFFIQGFDFGAYESLDANQEHFEKVVASQSEFARNNGITCIPVQTNLRHLDDNDDFFYYDCFGAALAAIPHLFSRRITAARIPSSDNVSRLVPEGSHPLLDPNYSSASVQIIHDSYHLKRIEKVHLVAEWDEALTCLRACFNAFRKDINCGECEKCLRTMTGLLTAGKLKDCPTYPLDDLTPEHLDTLIAAPPDPLPEGREKILRCIYRSLTRGNSEYWLEMLEPLRKVGRDDLADAAAAKLAESKAYRDRLSSAGLRGAVRRLDQKLLNGSLAALRRRLKRG